MSSKIWIGQCIKDENIKEEKSDDFFDFTQDLDTGSIPADRGEDKHHIPLHVFDPWGATPKNEPVVKNRRNPYALIGLKRILKGELPPGSDMYNAKITSPERANEISVVLFMIALTDTDSLEELEEYVSEVTDAGLNPILVVTQIDMVEDEKDNKRFREKIIASTQIKEADIFFVKNYTNEKLRSIKIDLSIRILLSAMFSRAKDYMKSRGRNYWKQVDWHCETVWNMEESSSDGDPFNKMQSTSQKKPVVQARPKSSPKTTPSPIAKPTHKVSTTPQSKVFQDELDDSDDEEKEEVGGDELIDSDNEQLAVVVTYEGRQGKPPQRFERTIEGTWTALQLKTSISAKLGPTLKLREKGEKIVIGNGVRISSFTSAGKGEFTLTKD